MIPSILMLLAWIMVGPSAPAALVIALVGTGLVAGLALRRSFRGRTIALLGVLGMMITQNLLLVLASFHIDFLRRSSAHLANVSLSGFSIVHTVDLTIALAGIIAALCAALLINFWKDQGASKVFRGLRLLEAPGELRESVNRLAGRAGVVAPEVWLIDSGVPSAFTVRMKGKYLIAVSVGLLESLEDREIEACIAHEISHLRNKDFTVRFLATLAKVALFAKPLGYVIEPAIYRAREFLADNTAANLISGPDALISALFKLQDSYVAVPPLLNPMPVCSLSGRKGLLGIFDKHPDLQTRIKKLEEMKRA
jgi:heat shock protein HtpX